MDPDQLLSAQCYKCHAEMIYVTSLPHPRAPSSMRRTTFVCYTCNQTRSYSLSTAMAQAYATAFGSAVTAEYAATGKGENAPGS
jgi:hypothetical protein